MDQNLTDERVDNMNALYPLQTQFAGGLVMFFHISQRKYGVSL